MNYPGRKWFNVPTLGASETESKAELTTAKEEKKMSGKKKALIGLGIAATGGLAYGLYKLLTRNKEDEAEVEYEFDDDDFEEDDEEK